MAKVAQSVPAAEKVVSYLLSFHGNNEEIPEEVRTLLEDNLSYITPSTVWILGLEHFWYLQEQMIIRL